MRKVRGFTLLEILLVVSSLAILSAIVIVAINPSLQLAQTRNTERRAGLRSIMDAINQYAIDNQGRLPDGVNGALRMIGTDTTGCSVSCVNCGDLLTKRGRYVKKDNFFGLINEVKADEGDFEGPDIASAEVDPVKVIPGDIMTITVGVSDPSGVDSVVADMAGIELVELSLKEGDEYDGIWETEWLVHSTKKIDYITVVRATDKQGNFSEKQIFWSDPSEWILPSGHEDPSGRWFFEANGYDGNTGSFTQNNPTGTGWNDFIVFNLPAPITSDRVRLWIDYLNSHIAAVDIDVYIDGAWVDVFQGGDDATWNCQWVELPYTKGSVEKARFRYNYSASNWSFWIYEFQFYETAAVVLLPTGNTLDATSVEETVAILHGEVTDDGGEPIEYRFQYGETTSYGTDTPWIGGKITGDGFSELITGLDSGVNYHFRAQMKNGTGTTNGDDISFFTRPGSIGWVSITGDDDPSGTWQNASYAYDDSLNTLSRNFHNIGDTQWSSFITFSRPEILSDKIMFYARSGAEVDLIDLDVFKDGIWTDVYQGGFADKSWVEQAFTEGFVSQARVRFHASSSNQGFYWELYELDFWKITETSTDECLDLNIPLVSKYLTDIPYDPRYGAPEKTYYCVQIDSSGRLLLVACQSELEEPIFIKR